MRVRPNANAASMPRLHQCAPDAFAAKLRQQTNPQEAAVRIDRPGSVWQHIAPADHRAGAHHDELRKTAFNIGADKPLYIIGRRGFEKRQVPSFSSDHIDSVAKAGNVCFRDGHDLIGQSHG